MTDQRCTHCMHKARVEEFVIVILPLDCCMGLDRQLTQTAAKRASTAASQL